MSKAFSKAQDSNAGSPEPKSCGYETVARNNLATVRCCSECGCVSVDIGPISVRLDPGGLSALWNVLGRAVSELESRDAAAPTVAHRGAA